MSGRGCAAGAWSEVSSSETEGAARRSPGWTLPRLHLVTDADILRRPAFPEIAAAVCAEGGYHVALHLRGHGGASPRITARTLHELATRLGPIAKASGTLLVVNDRVDVALAAGVRAVQLGGGSLSPSDMRSLRGTLQIGRSVHSVAEAVAAADADWLLAGTLFPSASHPGRAGAGTELVTRISEAVGAPILGIGGVTPDRVAEVLGAGAHGVAVRGGVWDEIEAPADAPAALHRYLSTVAERPSEPIDLDPPQRS